MLPDGTVSGITSMQVDQTSNTDEKQGKESDSSQVISSSLNNQNDEGNHQNVLNMAEQHAFPQESKFHTDQLEDGPYSLPKGNVEPIKLNTTDLHSILKSLDGNVKIL